MNRSSRCGGAGRGIMGGWEDWMIGDNQFRLFTSSTGLGVSRGGTVVGLVELLSCAW
jgi:hypothetical protein